MPPTFPSFKEFELSDALWFTGFLRSFPPYSDFDFASLWAWDIKSMGRWCVHRGNLVIAMRDYTSGQSILTFIGTSHLDLTASDLLEFTARTDREPALHLVPGVTAEGLNTSKFSVIPSIDHYDYVYCVTDHLNYSGRLFRSHRGQVHRFERAHANVRVEHIDALTPSQSRDLLSLWTVWQGPSSNVVSGELAAFQRFLASAEAFHHVTTAIYIDNQVIAFDVTVLDGVLRGNSLFAKCDHRFTGVSSVLQREVSRALIALGCTEINFEQDLGLSGLRKAKSGFRPRYNLPKYTVTLG